VLAALAVVTQGVSAAVSAELRLLWLVAGSSLLTLIWVDALTTWLPTPLLHLVAGELLVALLLGAALSPTPGTLLSRAAAGALANGVIFALLWWFGDGLGFGDVRLAPLSGAIAGTLGITGWYTALLLGALAGVLWGLSAKRHPAPGTTSGFAYGPALWFGPYAAYLWLALV
jgi:leader peptidase (prepilin peptidase)/N-methyltransferase